MSIAIYRDFEQLCVEIFKYNGLAVKQSVRIENYNIIDLVLISDIGKKAAVEIKIYRTRKPNKSMLITSIMQLKELVERSGIDTLMLIVGLPLEEEIKLELKNEHNIHVIDTNNLLYLTKGNESLKNRLHNFMSDIPSNITKGERLEKVDLDMLFNYNSHINDNSLPEISKFIAEGDLLKSELAELGTGSDYFAQYEKKGEEILRYLFADNLNGWQKQLRTDDNLNRYDLICRVKRGNEFWDFLVDEFHSRYILFEFKNYSEKVKQNQVHNTEKYLFQKALRNVCFVISREGLDKNALLAAKGILRESGKLFISISDAELSELLKIKAAGGEPSDFLFELVDDYLLTLSK